MSWASESRKAEIVGAYGPAGRKNKWVEFRRAAETAFICAQVRMECPDSPHLPQCFLPLLCAIFFESLARRAHPTTDERARCIHKSTLIRRMASSASPC